MLDGDMGVRRTRLTLEALDEWAPDAGWFHYGNWSDREFDRLRMAIDGYRREGAMPRPGRGGAACIIKILYQYSLSHFSAARASFLR